MAEPAPPDVAFPDRGTADAPVETEASAEASRPDATAADAIATEAASPDAAPDALPAETGVDPFACLGQPLPTTAPATVQISGTTVSGNQATIDAVTVEAFIGASTIPAATTTSAATGTYSLDLATGGAPVDGYLHASKAGLVDTFYYPPVPVTSSINQGNVLLVTPAELGTFATLGGVTQDSAAGTLVLAVLDCQGRALMGATVDVQPAGTIRYLRNNAPNTAATSTDVFGLAVVFNVPPGAVTVGASVNGRTLRQHALDVRATVLTISGVSP
jgi:hypothetical protein